MSACATSGLVRGRPAQAGDGEGLHNWGMNTGVSPQARPHDNDQGPSAAVGHRVDLRARPCPGAPHAMAGRLNEPVPASPASLPCAVGRAGRALVGADDARVHAHIPVEAAALTGPHPGAVAFPHRPPRPTALGQTTNTGAEAECGDGLEDR